jgi:hypothetical protein
VADVCNLARQACRAGSGGRDQEWTPDGGIASLKERVRGAAEDAKEGGSYGVAPHEFAARVHEATRGAFDSAGDGLPPATSVRFKGHMHKVEYLLMSTCSRA